MAASHSKWTKIAANTGNPPTVTSNVSIVQSGTIASGTNGHVRHECLMWLDGTDVIYTEPFDWAINGDLSIVLNGTLNVLTQDAGSVDIYMYGSIDGTNYVEMVKMNDDWNAGGASGGDGHAEAIGTAIYDFDTYGKMPYMKIGIDCSDDADCIAVANNVKINVFAHNG